MYDSYYNGEFIIVDRFSYQDFPIIGQSRSPKRGDVAVFKPGVSEEKKYFIKRIIGLPGETIKIEGGNVYIKKIGEQEFTELEESYLSEKNAGNTFVKRTTSEHIYEIPAGKYFVMGDNRQASTDSRSCFSTCSIRTNYIELSQMTGRILMDLGYFSFANLGFTHPDITKDGKWISTKPRYFSSPGTHTY